MILVCLRDPAYYSPEAGFALTVGMMPRIRWAPHLQAAQVTVLHTTTYCAKAFLLLVPHNLAAVTLVAFTHWPLAFGIFGALRLDTLSIVASAIPLKLARKELVALAFRVTTCIIRTLHFPAL